MKRIALTLSAAVILSACSTVSDLFPTAISSSDSSDGAPVTTKNVDLIADAQPKPVIRTRAGNKSPYTVLGKTYTLLPDSQGYQEVGNASWYGTKFHGRYTANGDVYDMWGMTAAHKTLPIPSYVQVTNTDNGRSVVVLVNDRGPFHSERIIDLSYAAAVKLGFADQGTAEVEVVDVTPSSQSVLVPQALTSVGTGATSIPQNTPPVVGDMIINDTVQPAPVSQTPPPSVVTDKKFTQKERPSAPAVFLQAAAFKSFDSAQTLQKKLQTSLRIPVVIVPTDDKAWHRVRVGPLNGVQMMSEARQVLYENGIKKPQVIKVP